MAHYHGIIWRQGHPQCIRCCELSPPPDGRVAFELFRRTPNPSRFPTAKDAPSTGLRHLWRSLHHRLTTKIGCATGESIPASAGQREYRHRSGCSRLALAYGIHEGADRSLSRRRSTGSCRLTFPATARRQAVGSNGSALSTPSGWPASGSALFRGRGPFLRRGCRRKRGRRIGRWHCAACRVKAGADCGAKFDAGDLRRFGRFQPGRRSGKPRANQVELSPGVR